MNPRIGPSLVVFLLLVALSAPASSAETAGAQASPPNIVLILSDDQAWTDYGFMGHPTIETPHLDKLAAESVLFRRGYVPTALCRPSLMTLVTGQYAHRHMVTGNDPSPKYAARDSELYNQRRADLIANIDRFSTLPELLGEKGYLSHQSGKWWEGNFSRGGFTHGMTRGFPKPGGRHGDDGLTIGRKGLEPIETFIDHSLAEEKPFFLWYAPFLPHTPHTPPERILKKYKSPDLPITVAKYYAMCDWFDETCGQLLTMLDDRNIADNTLVVYVTDNGWIQNPEKNGYAPRSKQTPYEGGVRTPIFLRWPEKLKPSDRPELVSSIDLVPTMLAAAGTESPDDLPGLNVLPNLESGQPLERDQVFGEGFAHDIADIETPEATLLYRWTIKGPWKLLLTYDGEVNRYKSSHPRTEKGPQLFHLLNDPHEKKNVAKGHAEIVAELAADLNSWYPIEVRKTMVKP